MDRLFEVYAPREWELAVHMQRGRKNVREDLLRCPMPGLVTAVPVAAGDLVRRGQEVVRLESMKMESSVASPRDGAVRRVLVQPGDAVETDQVLLEYAEG